MKKSNEKVIVNNRRARHDYFLEDELEAGLSLTGTEVKSLRMGRASLAEAFVSIDRRGEVWLENANIPEYLDGTWTNHAPRRKRKLLLHAKQIAKLARRTEAKGYTIAPLSLYFNEDGRAKLRIALARGKKEYDKRAALRAEDDKRAMQRAIRLKNLAIHRGEKPRAGVLIARGFSFRVCLAAAAGPYQAVVASVPSPPRRPQRSREGCGRPQPADGASALDWAYVRNRWIFRTYDRFDQALGRVLAGAGPLGVPRV